MSTHHDENQGYYSTLWIYFANALAARETYQRSLPYFWILIARQE